MNHSADPRQDYELAEATRESRRARQLSQAEGRPVSVDGFALPVDLATHGDDPSASAATPTPQKVTGDPFTVAQKLKIERWRKEAREAGDARRAAEQRELCEAFLVPSAGEMLTVMELFPEMAVKNRR
jgi:hypothetical protein